MQGTWVRALVWKDPICHGATKPVHHNYCTCSLEPVSHSYWAHVPQLLSSQAKATEPASHNYWDREPKLLILRATTTEPACHNYWARVPQLLKPMRLEPELRNKRSHRNEKPSHRNEQQPLLAAARESPHAAMMTQHSQKIKKENSIFFSSIRNCQC